MKVIARGTPQRGWAKELGCTGKGNGAGGCGAQLLVEQDDVFRTASFAMGECTAYATFRCCECGVWTDIDVPFEPREKLAERDGIRSGDRICPEDVRA